MEQVHWGVPSLNKKKEEKYNTPVITMSALNKKGAGRKLQFNKAAIAALNLVGGNTNIAFGFMPNNEIVVAPFDTATPTTFILNKSYGIRDKRTFEYIARILELDTNVENDLHFNLVEGIAGSNNFLKYVSYTNETIVKEEPVVLDEVTEVPSNSVEEVEEAVVVENKVISEDAEPSLDEQW
ncbi:MAG: hypothetical protein GOVbin3661_23 [Prokaryotic dsDNA virus sp.]|nr:MAG: hypothetical protein GOVbin3661_23 [Prokaryotic dsDNA virus sp.]|tara:strand:+ start:1146 stop:1691 length:546 start_codon:yes stop_codon:yes gene_type:complete